MGQNRSRVRLSRRQLIAALPLLDRVRAQDSPPVSFSTDVKLVNLFATVRDRQGRVVKGLAAADFELYEDERRQTIRYFSAESNVPLRVGLIVDISGSMARRLADEREASHRFFHQVLRPEQDRAFLIRFDQQVEVMQPPTGLAGLLDKAAGELPRHAEWRRERLLARPVTNGGRCGYGSSAIRDAVFVTCREILRRERGRKALIVLSDGLDNGSCVPLRTAIEAAQRADAIVYTLLFLDPGPARVAKKEGIGGYPGRPLMEQVAARTGGRLFLPGLDTTLTKAFAAIEEDLRNQYGIAYTPDAPSAGFHQIRVETRQRYVVQTREGYYGE